MDKISSYSGFRSDASTSSNRAESSSRSGKSSMSRDNQSRLSLGRTADRISTEPSLSRSYAITSGSKRQKSMIEFSTNQLLSERSERISNDQKTFNSAMDQKFSTKAAMSSGASSAMPGVRSEAFRMSNDEFQDRMSSLKNGSKEDRQSYKQWSSIASIQSGRQDMLRKEFDDYKSGKTNRSYLFSHTNDGASSRSSSSNVNASSSVKQEIYDADESVMSRLSNLNLGSSSGWR